MKRLFGLLVLFSLSFPLFAQGNIISDTAQATNYVSRAISCLDIGKYDSSIVLSQKAAEIKLKYALWDGYLECQELIAKSFENLGKYDTALAILSLAIEKGTKELGERSLPIAQLLQRMGSVYTSKQDLTKALAFLNESLEMKKELLGEKHLEVAAVNNLLGITYDYKGDYNSGLECFQRALLVRKAILGEIQQDVANGYNNIGLTYEYKGENDSALTFILKALHITELLPGNRQLDIADRFSNLGNIYDDKGLYDSALFYKLSALKIKQEMLGENNRRTAQEYANIGVTYSYKGNLEKALEYNLKALYQLEDILGEKHPSLLMLYSNIGNAYKDKGEYNEALKYYFRALSGRKEVYGEQSVDVAETYNNIGNTYTDKGEYDLAMEYHFKALGLFKEIFGEKHNYVALSYNNLGTVFLLKDSFDIALSYFLKGLEIRKAVLGEKHPDVGASYFNIANVYEGKGAYEQALAYNYKALQLLIESLGEKHPDVGSAYHNIGIVYKRQGNKEKAHEFFQKAIDLRKNALGEKHPDITQSYTELAELYYGEDNFDKALENYQKGIIANCKDFNETGIYANPLLENYLKGDYLLDDLQGKAVTFLLKALIKDTTEELISKDINASYSNSILCDRLILQLRKSFLQKTDKINLNEKAKHVYDSAIRTCYELLKNNRKDKYKTFAFDYAEKSKQSVLFESIVGKEGLASADIPDTIVAQEHKLIVSIAYYERKIAEAPDSALMAEYREQLFTLNREYEYLIAVIEKNYPEYYILKYDNKNIEITDLQKILDGKTAIRSYFEGDSILYVFTLTSNDLQFHTVPKIPALDDTIKCFRKYLASPEKELGKDYYSLARLLYNQFFPDSLVFKKNIENLVVIPDGVLTTLPFEALIYEDLPNKTTLVKNYPFLIKRFNMSYSYSANLYYHTVTRESKRKSEKAEDWLAFAPVFSSGDTLGLAWATHEIQKNYHDESERSSGANRALNLAQGNCVAELPGTENEVKSILKEYEKNKLKGKVLLHGLANKSILTSDEIKKYRVLHFATHGFVNSEAPELSGLLFAADSSNAQAGILYSGEIYNLELNADLVVLSACETGLGKIRNGEGLIGLSRSLLYAGAKNLVVSLWQVNDNSTSELMIQFYRDMLKNKQQRSYGESLRDAKLKMIREGKYAHPFYWSPFILLGI